MDREERLLVDDLDDVCPRASFLTDINKQLITYKLSNYEIQLPNNDKYNTQYEQARFALEKAELQYRKTKEFHEKRMAELDAQE